MKTTNLAEVPVLEQVTSEAIVETSQWKAMGEQPHEKRLLGLAAALGRVSAVLQEGGFNEDLRQELIQVAAKALAWAQSIKR